MCSSDLLLCMDGLAGVYLSEGRYPDAERLYLETLAIKKRVLGARHPETLNTMYNLGCLSSVRGDRAEGMNWIRQAVEGGYINADVMVHDTDLKALHGPEFDALLDRARRNAAAARAPGSDRPKN